MNKNIAKTVTKFNIPCYFGGKKSQVAIYIGSPEKTHHPIFFQSKFIQDERGGVIPQEIMDSLAKLKKLADENGVPFEELCKYALSSLSGGGESNKKVKDDEKEQKVENNHDEINNTIKSNKVVNEENSAELTSQSTSGQTTDDSINNDQINNNNVISQATIEEKTQDDNSSNDRSLPSDHEVAKDQSEMISNDTVEEPDITQKEDDKKSQ